MDFRISSGEPLTAEQLANFIGRHRTENVPHYQPLLDAYLTHYHVFGEPAKDPWKPDNRIAVNFAKYLVDTMNGFFMGIPVKVTSDDEAVAAYVNKLDAYNDQDDGNAELSKMCDIFGKAYEMYYVDDNGEICIAQLDPLQSFMIFDDSILRRPRAFVRLYVDADKVWRGSVSTEKTVRYFSLPFKWEGEETIHGFDGVPAVEYTENREQIGLYAPVLNMIDAYNKAVSEKANDVDYFADAYFRVLGAPLESEGLQNIRNNRIVNFDGEGAENIVADFVERPSGDGVQENLLDRLERLIFEVSQVADLNSESFGNASGIALKYRLQGMSNLAMTKELKFKAGMALRYKTIFSNPASGMAKDAWATVRYKFTRNFPANLADEAEIAGALAGVVSKETQLSVLSIVDDVEKEKDRITEDTMNAYGDSEALRGLFGLNDEQP